MNYGAILCITLSAAVGGAVGAGSLAGFAVSALLPSLWVRQRSSAICFGCAVVYYLVAVRALVLVSRNFLGPDGGLLDGLALWSAAALALASPWKLVWSESAISHLWRVPLGLLASIVPPLGIIGFASPTVAAGILFPASGYLGFVLTLMVPGCLAVFPRHTALFAGALAVMTNLMHSKPPESPSGWQGIDTFYGGIAHEHVDPVREYQITEDIKARALASSARVIVFPESVLVHWTDASDLFWTNTVNALQAAGKVIVLGVIKRAAASNSGELAASIACLNGRSDRPLPIRTQPGPSHADVYTNALVVRGTSSGELTQRVPVPIGMWRPFTNSGVQLRPFSAGTMRVQDQTAAVLICYEQLIPWPLLTSFLDRPSVIIAVANQFWVAGTSIPNAQQNTTYTWSRLFYVPSISAANR